MNSFAGPFFKLKGFRETDLVLHSQGRFELALACFEVAREQMDARRKLQRRGDGGKTLRPHPVGVIIVFRKAARLTNLVKLGSETIG